jgi:hypothetical protein
MQRLVSSPEYADKIYRYVSYKEGRNAPFEVKRTAMVSVTASVYSSNGSEV